MFIQGDLQVVFDALYLVGAIDPVLKMDWNEVTEEMTRNPRAVNFALQEINSCRGNKDKLVKKLNSFEPKVRNYIALEVAREFCEFHDRKQLQ